MASHEVPSAWNAFLSSILFHPHLLKDHPSRSISNAAAISEGFTDFPPL